MYIQKTTQTAQPRNADEEQSTLVYLAELLDSRPLVAPSTVRRGVFRQIASRAIYERCTCKCWRVASCWMFGAQIRREGRGESATTVRISTVRRKTAKFCFAWRSIRVLALLDDDEVRWYGDTAMPTP